MNKTLFETVEGQMGNAILNVPSLWNKVRPGLLLLGWENDWISLKVFREIESDWVRLEMHL